MAEGRALRFGVQNGDHFAPYWKATTSANRPEAYITLLGLDCHVSLHEAAAHWHFKIRTADGEAIRAYRWDRPQEMVPGLIRGLCLISTPAVVSDSAPRGVSRVRWVPLGEESRWNTFDIFLEQASPAQNGGWPGRDSMGTVLVGRLPLANGWQLTVVHHTEPPGLAPFSSTGPPPQTLERLKTLAASNQLRMVLAGDFPDGTIALVNGAVRFS